MECLIVVDMQRDFLPGGTLAVEGGDEIIETINRMQADFPLVVASQDWHPMGHMSFASAHPDRQPLDVIHYRGIEQVLWPDHCIQGTVGATLDDRLQTTRIEAIFRKGTDPHIDSYSAFFDNGRAKRTGLAGYLNEKGVTAVTVCGIAADFCVYYTAMDALDLGFKATIALEATRAIDADGYSIKEANFIGRGGIVDRSQKYVSG